MLEQAILWHGQLHQSVWQSVKKIPTCAKDCLMHTVYNPYKADAKLYIYYSFSGYMKKDPSESLDFLFAVIMELLAYQFIIFTMFYHIH